jgi:quercetin dioxygenase-like cupin family protein
MKMLVLFVVSVCAAFALGAYAASGKQMIVTPFAEAKLVPADPKNPGGARIAVLSGDPTTGPSAMLMEFGKNTGRMHVHSSDYHLVVLEGTMKHTVPGQAEADAPALGRGSYWFQPGNDPHADTCLSEKCLMFITWAGKRDGRLAE